jgi:hypothetical protein
MAAVGGLVETFGPFLIPVVVFVLGAFGYVTLLALTRWFGAAERLAGGAGGDGQPADPGPRGAGQPKPEPDPDAPGDRGDGREGPGPNS